MQATLQNVSPVLSPKKTISFLALFLVFFVSKLHGIIDISAFVLLLFTLWSYITFSSFNLDKSLTPYASYLFFLALYSGIITFIYGGQEIIFFFKFSRTFLVFFLLYFSWKIVSEYIDYELFLKYLVLMTVFHSIIVILCVSYVDIRDVVYTITGYVPRGPAWSRSPGLTISFNAPTIVHVLGLWILLTRRYWPVLVRAIFAVIILFSLIFLGRTIAFAGLSIILFYHLILERRWLITGMLCAIILALFSTYSHFSELGNESEIGKNLDHFMEPLLNIGSEGGVDSYFSDTLGEHIYFADDAKTIFFGNSLAGHVGLLNSTGETNSDLGVINSINANGLFVTVSIYIFYFMMIWQIRRSDWKTFSIVALLSLVLTFKETGFFTSHATPVLFFLFFYNFLTKRIVLKLP